MILPNLQQRCFPICQRNVTRKSLLTYSKIRNNIYRLALTHTYTNPHTIWKRDWAWRSKQDIRPRNNAIGLLGVNKQVWKEATAYLYKSRFNFTEFVQRTDVLFDFFRSMDQNVTLVENLVFGCIDLDAWMYDDQWGLFGLLGTSTCCRSIEVSRITLPGDLRGAAVDFWNSANFWNSNRDEFLNSRELARLLFLAFREWFENMEQGQQDWKSSFMARQDTMEIDSGGWIIKLSWDRPKFYHEFERLLQDGHGLWMGTLDGEATILWNGLDWVELYDEWVQLPFKPGSCRMEERLSRTRHLRRVFHLGDYADA